MIKDRFQHFWFLFLASLFISTAGPLGRYIDLAPPLIIWWRAFIAIFFLGGYCIYRRYPLIKQLRGHTRSIILCGILMTIHWVAYFYALKLSNVAIGMLAVFTFPIMTVFLEPFFLKTKLQSIHLLFGLLILVGIYFLVPKFSISNETTIGLLLGLLSALAYAIRNIIVKTKIVDITGSSIMLYHMIVMTIILIPVLFYFPQTNVKDQFPYLLFLGIVATSLGHTLFANSFKNFNITTVSILNSIQPVIGIFLAFIFLNEVPTLRSFIGGSLILATVVLEGIRESKNSKHE